MAVPSKLVWIVKATVSRCCRARPRAVARVAAAIRAWRRRSRTLPTSSSSDEHNEAFDAAVVEVRSQVGSHPLVIGGARRAGAATFTVQNPADRDETLGTFADASANDVADAVAAARAAFPAWSATPHEERARILQRAADLIRERVMFLGAVVALEVGKNRVESVGEVEEGADLISYYADRLVEHHAFRTDQASQTGEDRNTSVLKPYGVFGRHLAVQFPLRPGRRAERRGAGGRQHGRVQARHRHPYRRPACARECLRDAGLPDGVFQLRHRRRLDGGEGKADDDNRAHEQHDLHGSLQRGHAASTAPSPPARLPAAVHRRDGRQEPGARQPGTPTWKRPPPASCARPSPAGAELLRQLGASSWKRPVEDPAHRGSSPPTRTLVSDGRPHPPRELARAGHRRTLLSRGLANLPKSCRQAGGERDGHRGAQLRWGRIRQRLYYDVPPWWTGVPLNHRLWQHEMFLPITMITAGGNSLGEGRRGWPTTGRLWPDRRLLQLQEEAGSGSSTHIERSVGTPTGQPSCTTTGAWPGFQPFGGWKGSGSTGKNAGGLYYVPLYMREQSRTILP